MTRNLITVATVVCVFALLATACSSGASTPAPTRPSPSVVNYGPSTSPGGASAPTANMAGNYTWYTDLAQAQGAARSQQKLILCVSTKPGCGLCEKFKNKIVPAVAQRCGQMSVGYIYDIRRPNPVDKTLRANLKGAALMPLVGFLTPELGWVHGFWGPRNTTEFLGDIATAQRIYPVASNRRVGTTAPDGPRMASAGSSVNATSVINEFGEREWGMPGDVWPTNDPEPIDAITGRPMPDSPTARPENLVPAPDTMLAEGPAVPPSSGQPSDALRPDGLIAPLPGPTAVGSPDAAISDAPTVATVPTGTGVAPGPDGLPPLPTTIPTTSPTRRTPVAAPARQPSLPPAPSPAPTGWSRPTPSTVAAPAVAKPRPVPSRDLESWGRDALRDALAKIRSGQFDDAKHTLRAVKSKLPDTDLAREASRGTVAIFNYKKMQNAHDSDERTKWLERAKRDLGSSMWGVLFSA